MQQVIVEIKDEKLLELIGSSASMYWMRDYAYTFKEGEYLDIRWRSENQLDAEKIVNNIVGPAQIALALGKMLKGEGNVFGNKPSELASEAIAGLIDDNCSVDGATADCVLQVAVFGKIVYG